jgi:uncharacterized delta-60 repeat protein
MRAISRLSIRSRSQVACVLLAATAHCAALAAPGDLDTTFSADGKVSLSVTSGADKAWSMVLQPDGKIVLAGTCDGDDITRFCIVRFDNEGSLDIGFGLLGGTSGRITDGEDTARAVAVAPNGTIVIAGYCFSNSKYDFCVTRLLPNGARDTTFGNDGNVVTSVTSEANLAYALAIQPDGKIVVVGACGSSTFRDFCVARYRVDGSLDTSFSGNGKLATDIVRDDYAYAVAIQSDGKIVVAGGCSDTASITDSAFCVVRYSSTGVVEGGFPRRFAFISPSKSEVTSIAIQPDDKIMLGGYCSDSLSGRACLLRLESAGTTDLSFSRGMLDGACSSGAAIALQADGKIAMVGTQGIFDYCVSLYNADGTLDQTFGSSGKTVTPVTTGDNFAQSVAVQPDGKIIAAGHCRNTNGFYEFCVARYAGGAAGYRQCSLDIDGDGQVTATIDSLIHARIALGLTGSAVIGGITFPPNAKRNVWGGNGDNSIRKYLVSQCGMNLP